LRPRHRGGDRCVAGELSRSGARRALGIVRCGVRGPRLLAVGAGSARGRDGALESVGALRGHAREGAHQALLCAAARFEGILVEARQRRFRTGDCACRARAQRGERAVAPAASRRSRQGSVPGSDGRRPEGLSRPHPSAPERRRPDGQGIPGIRAVRRPLARTTAACRPRAARPARRRPYVLVGGGSDEMLARTLSWVRASVASGPR
jgi:hypothetical protein